MTAKTVDISAVVLDATLYPRTQVNMTRVEQLVDAVRAGAELPPIVCTPDLRVLDGWHRYEAWKRLGMMEVPVAIRKVASEAEAFAVAVELNVTHGLPLQRYDQRRIVLRMRELGFEPHQISELVRVPGPRLEEIIREAGRAPDGRLVPVKRGLEHLAGKKLTGKELEVNRRYQGFRAEFYARQLLYYLATRPPISPQLAELLLELRSQLEALPLGAEEQAVGSRS